MKRYPKILVALICISILAMYLAGCGKAPSGPVVPEPQKETPEEKEPKRLPIDHLRIGTNQFSAGMEPTRTSNADAQTQYNIYETLIMLDPYSEKIEYIPGLAESWKQIDPLTWEFKLRKNVKFHDGNTMTAEDVAFSLNRLFEEDDKRDSRFNNSYGRYFNTFEKVEIVDDYTVNISTKVVEPLALMLLTDLSGSIVSKAYIEKVGYDEADLKPVGTGPYIVTEFVSKEMAVLERFDDYWGEKAPVQKVTYKYIPEVASRVTAIANNEIDIAVGIPTDQESVLDNKEGVRLINTTYPLFHVMVINMGNEYMGSHKKLRQALDMAIDREALNNAIWGGKGIVPISFQLPEVGADMYFPDLKLIKYDPEKAKELVKESGYDGRPIVITIRANYYVKGDIAMQAIMEMWKEIGVNAELQQVPDVNKIPDPEVMIRTWSNPMYYPDPMGLIDASWSPTIWVSTRNLWIPSNPDWFANYETARFSTDLKARQDAVKKLLVAFNDEACGILMYVPHEYIAVRDDIHWEIQTNYRAYTIGLKAGDIWRISK